MYKKSKLQRKILTIPTEIVSTINGVGTRYKINAPKAVVDVKSNPLKSKPL
jgi:hypothetical protein